MPDSSCFLTSVGALAADGLAPCDDDQALQLARALRAGLLGR